jgi:hypothetical protein
MADDATPAFGIFDAMEMLVAGGTPKIILI